MTLCLQALSASVPNFIEIGGGLANLAKQLVDLTRNDPKAVYPKVSIVATLNFTSQTNFRNFLGNFGDGQTGTFAKIG